MVIDIGKDFSEFPHGRYYSDGPDSGEKFREELLLPRLKNLGRNEKLKIILDNGVEGYGSSFLVEAFARIVKYGYMTSEELLSKLDLSFRNSDYEFYKEKILQYISDAKYNSSVYKSTKKS